MSKLKISQDNKKRSRDRLIFGLSCTLCLILVVCAIYFSVQSYRSQAENNRNQIISNQHSASETEVIQQPSASSSQHSSQTTSTPQNPQPSSPESGEPVATVTEYMTPLSGALGQGFSNDALVFSETMGDWRPHAGVDFLGSVGDVVCSIGDGIVLDAYFDELTGHTIKVEHPDGCISVYCGLSEVMFVNKGDMVGIGDPIGSIGQSLPFEGALPAHLHLEVIQNGVRIDPLELIG